MSQYAERYARVNEEREGLLAERQQILAEAGALLIDHPDLLTGPEAGELVERDTALSEQFRATESLRNRIEAVEKRLDKLEEKESSLRTRLRELSQDLDPIYMEIGRIAFDVYRTNPLVDQEYADVFSPLVEVYSEIAGIDASVAEQQALLDDKPFLEKMVIRGKIALLKNRRATREGTLRRLIRGAGQEIMKTGFVDEIADPSLTQAAEPYRERMKETRECEDELASLEEERVTLRKELASLGVEKRPSRRIRELDDELATLSNEQEEVRATLAERVLAGGPDDLPEEIHLLFNRASEQSSRLEELNALVARLQAAMDVERLERESELVQAELERKEGRQAELKQEIGTLKKRTKSVEADLEAARSTMGSPEELLDNP